MSPYDLSTIGFILAVVGFVVASASLLVALLQTFL